MKGESTRIATEIKIRGLSDHVALSGPALTDAFQKGDVEAVFKYGNAVREDPGGVVKDVFSFAGDFLKAGRPTSTAIITTASEDRDGDSVHTDGMILTDGYLKHPIVMPMHLYREFPVGFTEKLTQYKSHVVARWQWLTDQPDTDGQKFYGLWESHVLNCVSIGFIPKTWEPKKDMWAYDFLTWELLEHSVVNIPANADALRTDGVKEYLRAAGEMIFSGPSTLLKGMFEAAEHQKVYATGIDLKSESDAGAAKEQGEPVVGGKTAGSAVDGKKAVCDTPEKILEAFEAGVISKGEAVGHINGLIDPLKKDLASVRRDLAVMSVRVISKKSEV